MTTTERVHAYPEVGDVIDAKYRIDGYLGEGGMGAVARAWHTLRQAQVALKFMAPHLAGDPAAIERFMNEAVAASQLKSEHIVQVYDVGKLASGSPYLVLEYLEGRDAAQLVEAEGVQGLEIPRATHIVFQVLRGLEVAHGAGIIHRDLKPSNCFLIGHESDPEFVKILDFGISKIQREGSASITHTNMALGTPLYMSPEQARSARDVDLRCDIYSTGVILYELLCGFAPHMTDGAEFTEVLFRLFTTDAPRITTKRSGLPDALVAVVHKALERERTARYASAREFAEALVPFCDNRTAIEVARFRAAQTHVVSVAPGRVRIQSSPSIDAHGTDVNAATAMVTSPLPASVAPPALEVERSPEPSVAKTDLSAASDAPSSTMEHRRARSPVPIVVGAAGAVAVIAAVYVGLHRSQPTLTAHDPVATTSAPITTTTPPVASSVAPPIPTPSATASAVPSTTALRTAATNTTQRLHLNTVAPIE